MLLTLVILGTLLDVVVQSLGTGSPFILNIHWSYSHMLSFQYEPDTRKIYCNPEELPLNDETWHSDVARRRGSKWICWKCSMIYFQILAEDILMQISITGNNKLLGTDTLNKMTYMQLFSIEFWVENKTFLRQHI